VNEASEQWNVEERLSGRNGQSEMPVEMRLAHVETSPHTSDGQKKKTHFLCFHLLCLENIKKIKIK